MGLTAQFVHPSVRSRVRALLIQKKPGTLRFSTLFGNVFNEPLLAQPTSLSLVTKKTGDTSAWHSPGGLFDSDTGGGTPCVEQTLG